MARLASCLALPVVFLLVVVAYRAALEGPSARPRSRVILYASGADAHWQAIIKGAKDAASRSGVELIVERPRSAVSLLRGAGSGRYSSAEAVGVIAAPDASSVDVGTGLAEGAALVTIGEDLLPNERLYHIGPGEYSTGRIAARLVREALPDGGAVLVLAPRTDAGLERLLGVQQTISSINQAEQLEGLPAKYAMTSEIVLVDAPHGADAAVNRAHAGHRVDVIVDLAGVYREQHVDAIQQSAAGKSPRWITVDESSAAMAGIEAGEVYAVLAADPQQLGYQAVSALALTFRSGPLGVPARGKGLIHVFPRVVRQGDVQNARAERLAAAPDLAAPRRSPHVLDDRGAELAGFQQRRPVH